MLQARSWAGISRHMCTSWGLPTCPHLLALPVEISYHKDKWLFDSLLRQWGEGEKGLDPQSVLCAPTQFGVSPREKVASNFGDCWSPSSSGEVKPAACWTWMSALILPGLEGRGRGLHTAVPGTCFGLAFPVTAFLPALCLSPVTQGHEPNLWITVKLQRLLC